MARSMGTEEADTDVHALRPKIRSALGFTGIIVPLNPPFTRLFIT